MDKIPRMLSDAWDFLKAPHMAERLTGQHIGPQVSPINDFTYRQGRIGLNDPYENGAPPPGAPELAPTQSPGVPAASPISGAGFRYQMGQNNYSSIRGQVESILAGTPLEAFTQDFIKAGERYGVDPRVLVTIANNESSLGKQYPQDSHNPFGYIVDAPDMAGTTGLEKEGRIWQGLRNAGFTSMPHAIDALTGRFQRQPTENYKKFYSEPTIENLQAAYNANPEEREVYLKNAYALAERFK